MKTAINLLAGIFILGVVALLIVGLYFGTSYLWGLYESLEPVVRVVLLTGVVAIFMSACIVAAGLRITARQAVNGRLSEARYDLYTYITDQYRDYVRRSKSLSNHRSDEVLTQLEQIESDIILLADAASLKAHHELKQAIESGEADFNQLMELLGQLVKCFRRDLGHAFNYEDLKFSELLTTKKEELAEPEKSGPTNFVADNA